MMADVAALPPALAATKHRERWRGTMRLLILFPCSMTLAGMPVRRVVSVSD
jgi:hypothetical protein